MTCIICGSKTYKPWHNLCIKHEVKVNNLMRNRGHKLDNTKLRKYAIEYVMEND